jgi:acyl-ACP thioesterase
MVDAEDRPLVRATSQWVLINLQTRRLTRVPEDIREAYPTVDHRMIEDRFLRLPLLEKPSVEREFHVRLSDLDVNQHANSASYIDWCLEAVPEAVHRNQVPLRFEINYLREASVRESLSSQSLALESGEQGVSVFAHQIVRQSNETRLAVGRSHWGPEPGM